MSISKISLPPVLERHELKYLIPFSLVEPISQFIEPYCQLDYHSDKALDNFYTVNSLYFDTRDCQFLQQRLYGQEKRFNMRARTYSDGSAPYYLEIKHKIGSTVKKYRATAQVEEWPAIITDPLYRAPESNSDVEIRNKELFMRLSQTYAVEPKIYTQYRRRAFFSTVDEYARITMDRDMKYRIQEIGNSACDPYNLRPDNNLTNYDNETIYATNTFSEANIILELKAVIGFMPIWMLDLIRIFQLKQVGFSKYMNSSIVARDDNGFSYMSRDRTGYY